MKIIKNLLKLLVLSLVIGVVSCLDDQVDDIAYTPEREAAIISQYVDSLKSNGYEVDTSDVGVIYTIIEEGEGVFPQAGDSIGVIYIGYFPESGTIFDASDVWYEGGIWKLTYLSTNVIAGFNDAIAHLNKDAEGLFLMPSALAYGPDGSYDGSIPPYSPLVFDIKLMDFYN